MEVYVGDNWRKCWDYNCMVNYIWQPGNNGATPLSIICVACMCSPVSLMVTCAIDFRPGWKGGPPSPAGMISNWKFSGPSSTPSSMTGMSTHDLFLPFSKSTS